MNDNEALLKDSGYFDEDWYLATNSDVKENPIQHYLLRGEKEGRKPSTRFCPTYYLNRYLDIRQAGVSPLLHYLAHGKKEKRLPRNPSQQILVSAYLKKNLGDDLFVDILLSRYQSDKVDFYLIGEPGQMTYFLRKYSNCHAYQNEPYHHFDGVVKIGGSLFREIAGALATYRNFFETLQKFQIPTFVLGCNFGPFQTAEYLEAFQGFFKNCRSVTVRDSKSYSYFENVPTVKYVPDIAFGYSVKHLDKESKTIGISILDLSLPSLHRGGMPKHTHAYEQKMSEIIAHYQKIGYKVRLFSFCEHEGDLKAIKRLSKDSEIINYTGDMVAFLAKFQTCERIIANRFHSLILAQLYGIPILPLVYNEKIANQLADVGLLEHACPIENISNLEVDSLHFSTVNPQVLAPMLKASPQHFQALDDFLKEKLVTVIVPTYNSVQFLKVALEGIFSQTHKNIQVIIIDDASTDGTQSYILEQQKSHPNLEYYRNPKNLGQPESLRIGYAHAKGDYVVFHDSDDYYIDDRFLETALDTFRQHLGLAFVSGNAFILENRKREPLAMPVHGEILGLTYLASIRNGIPKPTSTFTTVFDRTVLQKSALHEMDMINDLSIYLRVLLNGNAYILKDRVGCYRIHDANITKQGSVPFIIANLAEYEKVYQLARETLPNEWLYTQVKLTINWFMENNILSAKDFETLKTWCLAHVKEPEMEAYLKQLQI